MCRREECAVSNCKNKDVTWNDLLLLSSELQPDVSWRQRAISEAPRAREARTVRVGGRGPPARLHAAAHRDLAAMRTAHAPGQPAFPGPARRKRGCPEEHQLALS
jgi:hypothetical protein